MRRSKNTGASPVVFGSDVEFKHRKNYTVRRLYGDSNGQKPAYPKTNQVHTQAEQESLREAKSIGGNGIERNALNEPNEKFRDKQGSQILSKEEA